MKEELFVEQGGHSVCLLYAAEGTAQSEDSDDTWPTIPNTNYSCPIQLYQFCCSSITSTSPFLESSSELTLGKPDSSHSLIIPMKSMDLVAMNSARKADITELSNKALEDTYTNSGVP